jgi:hypothetical protein
VLLRASAALALASCRGGDEPDGGTAPAPPSTASMTLERWSTPTGDPLVEEMTDELMADADLGDGASPLAEPQARCLSSSLVRGVGLEALARAGDRVDEGRGLDLATLDRDERRGFAAALLNCLDLPQVLASQLRGIEGLGPEGIACAVARLTADGAVTELVRRSILDGSELVGREDELAVPMQRAFERCLGPEQLERLGSQAAESG